MVGTYRQLKLIKGPTPQTAAAISPVMRLHQHAVLVFDKVVARCGLGPKRRQLLEMWLTVFDEDVLMQAFEGAAADAWVLEQGGIFTTPEWILRDEANIERFAERGAQLRDEAASELVDPAVLLTVAAEATPEDVARSLAFRARVLALADERAGRTRRHG